jgi:Carboxypeptidase regulatory-like domain
MSNRLRLPLVLLTAVLADAQQATVANPDRAPDVFLDNHRPVIQKKEKPPTARTVKGKVVDDTGQPLEGAIVTLMNSKTHERTQVITKKEGRFNFDDVSFTIDYELQARYKNLSSEIRKLSQYDRSPNVVRILQIESDRTSASREGKKEAPPQLKK